MLPTSDTLGGLVVVLVPAALSREGTQLMGLISSVATG